MKKLVIIILSLTLSKISFGQLDSLKKFCGKYLQYPYISDGQQYLALLNDDQTAEFKITFFAGTTYRIVACSEPKENSLIFSVYDQNYNLLFSNEKFGYSTYWDLKFTSTVSCIIQAKLPPGKSSGFAFLLIGFKQIE